MICPLDDSDEGHSCEFADYDTFTEFKINGSLIEMTRKYDSNVTLDITSKDYCFGPAWHFHPEESLNEPFKVKAMFCSAPCGRRKPCLR